MSYKSDILVQAEKSVGCLTPVFTRTIFLVFFFKCYAKS